VTKREKDEEGKDAQGEVEVLQTTAKNPAHWQLELAAWTLRKLRLSVRGGST
jgi:hypothetical protein